MGLGKECFTIPDLSTAKDTRSVVDGGVSQGFRGFVTRADVTRVGLGQGDKRRAWGFATMPITSNPKRLTSI